MAESTLIELIYGGDWDDVRSLLKKNPSEASRKFATGNGESIPLHEACKSQPPDYVIEALLAACKEAAYEKDQWGCLPIHLACKCAAPVSVVERLIHANPTGLRQKDSDGKIPLHVACEWGAQAEVVNLILIHYPEGVYVHSSTKLVAEDYLESEKCSDRNRDEIRTVLSLSPAYCAVAKAASMRTHKEVDAKIRSLADVHSAEIATLETKHYHEMNLRRERASSSRDDIAKLNSTITRLTRESNDEINNLEKKVLNLQYENERLESIIQVEKEQTKTIMDKLNTSQASGKKELSNLSSEIHELKERSETEIQRLKTKVDKAHDTQNSLSRKLKDKDSKLKDAEKDIGTMVRYTKQLKNEIEQLKRENQNLENECFNQAETISNLRETCEDLNGTFKGVFEKDEQIEEALKSQDELLNEIVQNRADILRHFTSNHKQLQKISNSVKTMHGETGNSGQSRQSKRSKDPKANNKESESARTPPAESDEYYKMETPEGIMKRSEAIFQSTNQSPTGINEINDIKVKQVPAEIRITNFDDE